MPTAENEREPIAPEAAPAPAGTLHPRRASSAPVSIVPCDFRHPAFLPEAGLRRLRLQHADFARGLGVRLSLFLRSEFELQLTQLATLDYATFTASLPDPAHLCLFKAEPLAGVGVLDLDPHLALSCADRMLGGRGQVLPGGRLLTEIEVALVDDIATIILEDWSALWQPAQELRTSIIGHENSGRFLQTSPREAIILVATLEAVFGEHTRRIQLGIPCHSIEPAVRKLLASPRRPETATKAAPTKAAWRGGAYDQITIPARAEWHIFDLPLREVAALRVGDTLELPASLLDQTELVLAGAPKFFAKVGLEGDHVALQLTKAISRSQPAASHAHPH